MKHKGKAAVHSGIRSRCCCSATRAYWSPSSSRCNRAPKSPEHLSRRSARACKGEYAQAAGFYFRRLHPDVEIEMADLDTLPLEEYDRLCGEVRRYLPKETVKAFREKFEQTYGHKKKAPMGADRQLFLTL